MDPTPGDRWWQRREAVLAAALLLLITAITTLRHEFLSPENLRNTLENAAPRAVAAAGMTALIVAGGIDISIGSILAVAAVAAAMLAKQGHPLFLVAGAAIGAGLVLGCLNGALVGRFGIPPIVATLATMGGLRGFMVWWTGGNSIRDIPPAFNFLSTQQMIGLPLSVWIAGLIALGMGLFLERTRPGRQCYAVGSNPRSAELTGISPRWVTFRSFAVLGALTGLAALLYISPFSFVQTDAGQGFELEVITAVVVGGTNIFGGQGTVLGSVLGVLLLSVIRPALTFLQGPTGFRAEWEPAVQGTLILATVLWDALARRNNSRALA